MDNLENIKNASYDHVGNNNHTEFGFIKDKPELVYLIKKLERIGSAVHIVTSPLSEEEPIRRALREECLLNIKNAILRESRKGAFITIEDGILHAVSLLDVAKGSMIISDMNANVLKRELLALLPVIQNIYSNEREKLSFDPLELGISDDTIKKTSKLFITKKIKDKDGAPYKGQVFKDDVFYKRTNLKDKNEVIKPIGHSKNIDSVREKMILDILKNRGEVGIKDISSLMNGVSSKTIQRDLGSLVLKDVLKKSGERRWSRYSLKTETL